MTPFKLSGTGPHFRTSLIEAREHLAEGREKLKQQHQQGAQGIHICVRLADLLDSLVLQLFEAALADLETDAQEDLRSKISLVVHGGLGRRVVSPFSDVDLMILHAPGTSAQVAPLAKRVANSKEASINSPSGNTLLAIPSR